MVTAEFAVVLMAVVVVVLAAMWGVGVGVQQLGLRDAAVQIARAEARGDHSTAQQLELRAAPAVFEVRQEGQTVIVSARRRSSGFGSVGSLELEAQATAYAEPTTNG